MDLNSIPDTLPAVVESVKIVARIKGSGERWTKLLWVVESREQAIAAIRNRSKATVPRVHGHSQEPNPRSLSE